MNHIHRVKDQQDIQEHFLQYLSAAYGPRMALLNKQQVLELERAFYSAWGQLIICQRDYLANFKKDAAVEVLEKWLVDVTHKFERG